MFMTLAFACSMAGKWTADTGAAPESAEEVDADTDGEIAAPGIGDLAITEVMKDPDAVEDDLGEWFEVTNLRDLPLSLAGLEVHDEDGDGFVVDAWPLGAGATVVFGASADTGVNGDVPVDVAYDVDAFKLGNDGGSIALLRAGATLDVVTYDGTFPDEEGRALSLAPGAYDPTGNDDAGAWCAAVTPYGRGDRGTPGAANDACAAGPTDTDGSVDERAPTVGDLVITEIMKDPDPTADETGEWFEIVNAADVPIALDGLTVTDAGGTGFTVLTDVILAPGQVYLFGVSADEARNGGITPDHVYAAADLRLGNGDDAIVLTFGGALIDAVAYDGDFPDESGKSLALDPTGYSAARNDDPDDWCEGDGAYGTDGNQGTPGAENGPCR